MVACLAFRSSAFQGFKRGSTVLSISRRSVNPSTRPAGHRPSTAAAAATAAAASADKLPSFSCFSLTSGSLALPGAAAPTTATATQCTSSAEAAGPASAAAAAVAPARVHAPFSAGKGKGRVRSMAGDAAAQNAGGLEASHGADSCIFCKIRDGIIPSTRLFETDHALAILDAFPMTRGHALLIPKKHYAFIEDMPAEEAAALLQEVPRLARAVRVATGAKGINVAQNNGSVAGQVVFHVHVHVLPRQDDDGLFKLGKSGPMIQLEEATEVRDAIVSALESAPSSL